MEECLCPITFREGRAIGNLSGKTRARKKGPSRLNGGKNVVDRLAASLKFDEKQVLELLEPAGAFFSQCV